MAVRRKHKDSKKFKRVAEKYILSDEEREVIWRMFFGPYKDEWKDGNGIVQNSDRDIAERLNIPITVVAQFIIARLDKHFYNLDSKHQ